MFAQFALALGPLRVALTLGEPEEEEGTDDDDEIDVSAIADLLRLGADTALFGFSPDPVFRDMTGWSEDEE